MGSPRDAYAKKSLRFYHRSLLLRFNAGGLARKNFKLRMRDSHRRPITSVKSKPFASPKWAFPASGAPRAYPCGKVEPVAYSSASALRSS